MTIQNHLSLQLFPILLDMAVLYHNHHHIHFVQELIEVQDLVLHDLLVGKERVKTLQRTGEVALLDIEHLEGRAFADVVHVFLVGNAVQAHAAVVGDAVLFHDLIDALKHEHRLAVVGFHRFVNDLSQLGIVTYEEPGIHTDAVAAHAGAGLQDIHARVHIADPDDLIHVHIVVAADATEFVGKGDVHGTEGILNYLGHFGRADVSDHNLALAERGVILLNLLAYLTAVGTDRAVVVQEFVHHVAGDNTFGCMDQVEVLPYFEAVCLDDGSYEPVDGAGADGALNDHDSALGAYLHHFLDGGHDVAGVHFLAELVVGRGDGDDVGISILVLRGKLDALRHGRLKQLVQAVFLERGLAGIEGGNEFLVVVRSDDLHAVGGHHKCRGQADVA